jgi:hypothetical protein
MRLDRNIPAGHGNKYGLIKNRELEKTRDSTGHFPSKIADALLVLIDAGILDWGATPDTEFFVVRLKDKHAGKGLYAYANSAMADDLEYGRDVMALAARSGPKHPFCKKPD